ncbi:ABC transporter ATP-binding protein, partial [Streptomyces angustmyceticus]
MAEQTNGTDVTERRTGTAPSKAPGARVPTVIADDLHIVYRVYGTGAGKGSATAALNRIV